jgi:hypothetical protein
MTGPKCTFNGCHNRAALDGNNEYQFKGLCVECAEKDQKWAIRTIFIILSVIVIMSFVGCSEIISLFIK